MPWYSRAPGRSTRKDVMDIADEGALTQRGRIAVPIPAVNAAAPRAHASAPSPVDCAA